MQILQRTFKVLTICGCWRPLTWSSPWKKIMYKFYTIFVILIIHTVTLSQVMDLILNVGSPDEFTENFYVFLAMFISCCKMCSLLMNHKNIAVMMDVLEEYPCVPVNPEETEIRCRFDKITQSNLVRYLTLVGSSVTCNMLSSIFIDFSRRSLPFRAWLPFDNSSLLTFSLTYVHQILGFLLGALQHIASDCLISGFLIHTSCQIEVLECRLKNMKKDENHFLKSCAQHHDHIYGFATMVNHEFRIIIFIQFFVSTLVVCFSLYKLTESTNLSVELYMSCMLTQIFIYCWYANEVKIKSLEMPSMIFGYDWISFDNADKKMLLMIMRRATVPIEITCAYIVPVNLESFVNILKTSYSAYTVLQQAQEKIG